MDRNELRDKLKPMLQQYLHEKGLPTDKPFNCINPNHEDKHPSMSYYPVNHTCRCFACGAVYDVFDLIQQDYDCGYVQSVEIANKKYGDMMDSRSVDKTKTTQKTQSTVKPKITIKKEEKSERRCPFPNAEKGAAPIFAWAESPGAGPTSPIRSLTGRRILSILKVKLGGREWET